MAIYLDEVHLGSDPAVIGFPHVLLCMGFVYVTTNRMYGIHLTNYEDTDRVLNVFNDWLDRENVDRTQAQAIYGSANLKVRYGEAGDEARWRNEMTNIAGTLGYTGPVRGFDTSIINPVDGTYIEYQAVMLAWGAVRILYKRNEKMNYGSLQHDPNVLKINVMNNLRNDLMVTSPSGADVKHTFGNKGNLHEVNYASRLMEFNA